MGLDQSPAAISKYGCILLLWCSPSTGSDYLLPVNCIVQFHKCNLFISLYIWKCFFKKNYLHCELERNVLCNWNWDWYWCNLETTVANLKMTVSTAAAKETHLCCRHTSFIRSGPYFHIEGTKNRQYWRLFLVDNIILLYFWLGLARV